MCNLQTKKNIHSKSKKPYKIFFAWSISINFVIFGLVLISHWSKIYDGILNTMVVMEPGNMAYDIWHKNPLPLSTRYFFYNWTNSEDIHNPSIKPKFQEIGPYVFTERKEKTNIIWNDNNTVTYNQKRTFWFDSDASNGNLSDLVHSINIVTLTAADKSRYWSYLLKKGLSLSLSSTTRDIFMTSTVGEYLFDGYQDPFLSVISKFSALSKDFPTTDKFAWFYGKNGSETFDGTFNMKTGVDGQIGELNYWQFSNRTSFYPGDCGHLNKASAGDFFPRYMTNKSTVKIFSADICRYLEMEYEKDVTINGILGYKYSVGDKFLDNGTKFPENKCYCDGDCMPFGAVNVSKCRQGSPIFVSLPHFFKAEPSYMQTVDGIRPPSNSDDFYIVIEPKTGVPLEIAVRVQINVLLRPSDDIVLFRNTPTLYFPVLYFEQVFTLSKGNAFKIQILVNFEMLCWITGLTFISTGLLIFGYTFYKWKKEYLVPEKEIKEKSQIDQIAMN